MAVAACNPRDLLPLLLLALLAALGDGGSLHNPRDDVRAMEGHEVGEAKRLFWRGVDHFNAARFEEAGEVFRACASRSSHYRGSSLFNMGLILEWGASPSPGSVRGAEDAAIDAYTVFLPPRPPLVFTFTRHPAKNMVTTSLSGCFRHTI